MKKLLASLLLSVALASPAAAARLQIIGLTSNTGAGNRISYQLAFWYDVPASRQVFYATPSKKSAWLGATTQDNTNLQNGSVYEEVVTYSPDGSQNLAQLEAGAQALWTQRNAIFQANNPWVNYGSTFDGTSWVITNIP